MAHRQLAEKYAAQLNEANKKIMELEGAVADAEVRIEQAMRTGSPDDGFSKAKVISLQAELDSAVHQIQELNTTIPNYKAKMESVKQQAEGQKVNIRAEVKELQQQLKTASTAEAEARNDLLDLRLENSTLQREMAKRERLITERNPGEVELQKQLDEATSTVTKQSDKIDKMNQKLRYSGQARGNLQQQLNRLKRNEAAAAEEIKRLEEEVRSATTNAKKARKAVDPQEVTNLQNSLDRERKRRSEAEALLGPDGKRCKKCNPIVVDLECDGDEHDTIAAKETEAVMTPPISQQGNSMGGLPMNAFGPIFPGLLKST